MKSLIYYNSTYHFSSFSDIHETGNEPSQKVSSEHLFKVIKYDLLNTHFFQ